MKKIAAALAVVAVLAILAVPGYMASQRTESHQKKVAALSGRFIFS